MRCLGLNPGPLPRKSSTLSIEQKPELVGMPYVWLYHIKTNTVSSTCLWKRVWYKLWYITHIFKWVWVSHEKKRQSSSQFIIICFFHPNFIEKIFANEGAILWWYKLTFMSTRNPQDLHGMTDSIFYNHTY